jgi:hypothetical protein
MVEFSQILEEFERNQENEPTRPWIVNGLSVRGPVAPGAGAGAFKRAAEAYSAPEETGPVVDAGLAAQEVVCELLAALNDPAAGESRLRDLRRRIAWLLHPDRMLGGGGVLPPLAQINSWIDVAIADRRKTTTDK